MLTLALGPVTPAVAQDLRLGYLDQEIYPFQMGDGAAVPSQPGLAVELVLQASRAAGARLTLARLPPYRLLQESSDGRLDGAVCISYTPQRTEIFAYPTRDGSPDGARRCARLRYVIYQLRGGSTEWNGKLLKIGNAVGVHRGFAILSRLRELGVEATEVSSERQLFEMLVLRRLDAVVTLEALGDQALLALPNAGRVEKLAPAVVTQDLFLVVTKVFYAKHKELTERIWSHIAEHRDDLYAERARSYER